MVYQNIDVSEQFYIKIVFKDVEHKRIGKVHYITVEKKNYNRGSHKYEISPSSDHIATFRRVFDAFKFVLENCY